MKAIILARVSTEEQIEDGKSVPAQLARAQEYARKKELAVISEYQFDESSLKEHRKKFEQVVEQIRKSKEKIALIVETVDRLQRSFKESVLLDEFRKEDKLEIHFIRESLIIHKNSNSSELQRWDLGVMLARSFVLQISDNVKRTYAHKLKNGEWINRAPIGYLNVSDEHDNKDIIVDKSKGHLIVKIFEMYASGNHSFKQIAGIISDMGLRGTYGDKAVCTSMVSAILLNPFYYGMMRSKGELYPHKYPPLISKQLFDKCQEVMKGWHKKPCKYAGKPFVLRGMAKCANNNCGCTITAENKHGYIYYSCTNYRKAHEHRDYIREEDMLAPINKVLQNISLSDEKIKKITEDLKKTNQSKNEFHKQSQLALRKEYDLIENRISNAFDLLADGLNDGSFTKDMFDKKVRGWKDRQAEILVEMQRYTDADENFYLTASLVLNLAKKAYELFQSSEVPEKRQLLSFILQNCELKGKNLSFNLKTPFDAMVLANECPTQGPALVSPRRSLKK